MSELDYTPIEIPFWVEVGFIPTAIIIALLMVYIPIFAKARRFSNILRQQYPELPQAELERTIVSLRWVIFKMSVKFINRGNPYQEAKQELADVALNEKDVTRAFSRSAPALFKYFTNWADRFAPAFNPAEDRRFQAEQQCRVEAVVTPLRHYLRNSCKEEDESLFLDLQERLSTVWKEWLKVPHLPVAVHRALHAARAA